MSADNGIYILETIGPEYRVAHLQAIDNLAYDESAPKGSERYNSKNPDVLIKNARKMWQNCQVFTSEERAMKSAMEMLKDCCVCEYGICYIKIDRKF